MFVETHGAPVSRRDTQLPPGRFTPEASGR